MPNQAFPTCLPPPLRGSSTAAGELVRCPNYPITEANVMGMMIRRTIGSATLVALVLASTAPGAVVAQEKLVRMGHQRVGAFALLKPRGILEERLKPLGYTVTWKEFPGGPQLLEAVKAGAIDFAHSGEAPPIFAQAAGTPLLYIGHEPAAPKAEAILVPKDSPIKTVADLKGKKIGLNKGSNVHYLLVRALEKAGLKYTDAELVYVPPADGRAAFEKGTIDAWVIWEPYRAAAEMSLGARTLVDGTGLVSNHEFFFVAKAFAQAHPQIIDVVLGAARDIYAEVVKDIPALPRRSALPPASQRRSSRSRLAVGASRFSRSVIRSSPNSRRSPTPSGISVSSPRRSRSPMRCGSQAPDTRGGRFARYSLVR
jgi:sulfonate transport system substrate-binding protein